MKGYQRHRAYFAFLGHRISGILLALFLPVHFYVLGLALNQQAALDEFLAISELPLVKFAEWGLVSLLALHFCFGMRLLTLELFAWSTPRQARKSWVTGSVLIALVVGFIFLLRVF